MRELKKYEFAVPFRCFSDYLKNHRHILHLSDDAIEELLNDLKPMAKFCEVDIHGRLRDDGFVE